MDRGLCYRGALPLSLFSWVTSFSASRYSVFQAFYRMQGGRRWRGRPFSVSHFRNARWAGYNFCSVATDRDQVPSEAI